MDHSLFFCVLLIRIACDMHLPSLPRYDHLSLFTRSTLCCHVLRPSSNHHQCQSPCGVSASILHVLSLLAQPSRALATNTFYSPCSCFSATSFQKFSFDHLVIKFCTSSRHASIEFVFLFQELDHFMPRSSSCSFTELPKPST